ncbi:hypothetical protein J437_LFUL001747, partial [Ladona fulva]
MTSIPSNRRSGGRQNIQHHEPEKTDSFSSPSHTPKASGYGSRSVKSVEVVETFIARIKDINPALNCVVDQRFEDALKEARAVDKLIESGTKSEEELARETPFLGVPFTTKDSIQVK